MVKYLFMLLFLMGCNSHEDLILVFQPDKYKWEEICINKCKTNGALYSSFRALDPAKIEIKRKNGLKEIYIRCRCVPAIGQEYYLHFEIQEIQKKKE